MAPAVKVPRVERTTRSSTRAQTSKSYHDEALTTKVTGPKDTKKIDKKRANATKKPQKTKKTTESEPKSATGTKPTQPNKYRVTSTPSSPTTRTITSPLVNKPITCHQYSTQSSKKPSKDSPLFIFTHGAGGTLSAPAVINFCSGFTSTSSTPLLAFQGSSNLGARVKGFHACHEHVRAGGTQLVFGGRSMGARAAVVAATEIVSQEDGEESGRVKLVLVSYPLTGPKDVRDGILLDLSEGAEVLFIVGDRDAMCPLELLEEVRGKMKAKTRLVVVRGADHGMNARPASRTKEVGEETGMVAAGWLSGAIESEGETLYVGNEE